MEKAADQRVRGQWGRWRRRRVADRAGDPAVGAQLERLVRRDRRWHCVNAVCVPGGADLEHLVVGPGGAFAVRARRFVEGRVWVKGDLFLVDGVAQDCVSASRHEALRAGEFLSEACGSTVPVTGVVVLVAVGELAVPAPPEDVHVLHRRALWSWLRRRPDALDAPAVDSVLDAARQSVAEARAT